MSAAPPVAPPPTSGARNRSRAWKSLGSSPRGNLRGQHARRRQKHQAQQRQRGPHDMGIFPTVTQCRPVEGTHGCREAEKPAACTIEFYLLEPELVHRVGYEPVKA